MAKDMDRMQELTDLPNIGSVLAQRLRQAGIVTPSDLKVVGSIEALLRVRRTMVGDTPRASMLCALEGAIRGVRWHEIPRDERTELWKRYQARAE